MLEGNQNINIDNEALQQVLFKLNSLEERFNGLQQEKAINIQTISTLEKAIKIEKRQIHTKPLTEKRNRIIEELKNELFYNEFTNSETSETYNKALRIVKSAFIKDIKDAFGLSGKRFNCIYNSLTWAIHVLSIGYAILHTGNYNSYRSKVSENLLFSKKVDEQFCDEYLDKDSPAEKQSYLHTKHNIEITENNQPKW